MLCVSYVLNETRTAVNYVMIPDQCVIHTTNYSHYGTKICREAHLCLIPSFVTSLLIIIPFLKFQIQIRRTYISSHCSKTARINWLALDSYSYRRNVSPSQETDHTYKLCERRFISTAQLIYMLY
jgi:hypothetical protein